MGHGAWGMAQRAWGMAHGAWRMAHGAWRRMHGAWRMGQRAKRIERRAWGDSAWYMGYRHEIFKSFFHIPSAEKIEKEKKSYNMRSIK
jgi:hypothetical protein